MKKQVFVIFIVSITFIYLYYCKLYSSINKPDLYEGGFPEYITANDNLRWTNNNGRENCIYLRTGREDSADIDIQFSCYTEVIGNTDKCIVFAQWVGCYCNYYEYNGYNEGVRPKYDPTFYILDFRSGTNILHGPWYRDSKFYRFMEHKGIDQRLQDAIKDFEF
jgi:hypothetical protein